MAFARSGPLRLYYETEGSGPPVVLIAGQAMTHRAWWRTRPVLAQSFRVLAFDNRGIGRSDHSTLPYTVAQMADDVIAVLDAAGEGRAHIYGISLGGMVAQEVALRHPDRVGALVLGATTAGGTHTVLGDGQALSFFVRAGAMAPEEAEWAAVPYNYGEATRRLRGDRIAEDIAHRLDFPTDTLAYMHQSAAAAAHSTLWRLGRIVAPTLVLHGEDDAVVPRQNAEVLADAIPGAELKTWPGAGHLYVTDEPRADEYVARFLERHSYPRAVEEPADLTERRLRKAEHDQSKAA
jgi:pimeloyl-ACP methyl ester carboxylesterase